MEERPAPAAPGSWLPRLCRADLEGGRVWIARGGFGDVYRGRSREWDLEVALKVMRGSREMEEELVKEAALMVRAQFSYTLRLLAIYRNPEGMEYGLVTEYMPNGSLNTLFKKASPVPWALKFRILHQVAVGMSYLHGLEPPLLHLDLKPSNVLLNKDLTVQLADFGLSKVKSETESRNTGGVAGTCAYEPPEAFRGGSCRKEAFDVYSYGILTWVVLVEKEPYEGRGRSEIMQCVLRGQRPDPVAVNELSAVKMVSAANHLMHQCWFQEAAERPTFRACQQATKQMIAAYEDEIDYAVAHIQEKLKKEATGDQQSETTSTSTQKGNAESTETFHASDFRTTTTPKEPSPASLTSNSGTVGTRVTPTANMRPVSKVQFLRQNWKRIVQNITAVQRIVHQLKQEGIFIKEEVDDILSKGKMNEQMLVEHEGWMLPEPYKKYDSTMLYSPRMIVVLHIK
ncbi:receptor-interacting serine/threonine-protein kinase 2-like isoform X1 [Ambystoma mexicanum]|uniref:receptor-interacting serine/threonine-protein kinase 2-like isoform X1 n=1 Tax=Ambystoma mexicanum TaxID=8296 RepID=UPI0037E973BF